MTDLIALKDFLVLCQNRSFSRAAERCHLSVSGLSRRIQGLEDWIGTPLFHRHRSGLELTDAGCRLQAVAAEVVYALEELRKSLHAERHDQQRCIRFCAPHIMSAVFFPNWFTRLPDDFKKARFSIDSHNLPECVSRLDKGEADYVVALFDKDGAVAARMGGQLDEGHYLALELGTEKLVPVSAPNAAGHPLFDLGKPATTALSFLDYDEQCHLGWSLRASLRHQGLSLQQQHSASLASGLQCMATSGLGTAWLPQTLIRQDLATKQLVRAGSPAFDVPLRSTLLRRRQALSSQAQHLWAYLSELTQAAARLPATAALPISERMQG